MKWFRNRDNKPQTEEPEEEDFLAAKPTKREIKQPRKTEPQQLQPESLQQEQPEQIQEIQPETQIQQASQQQEPQPQLEQPVHQEQQEPEPKPQSQSKDRFRFFKKQVPANKQDDNDESLISTEDEELLEEPNSIEDLPEKVIKKELPEDKLVSPDESDATKSLTVAPKAKKPKYLHPEYRDYRVPKPEFSMDSKKDVYHKVLVVDIGSMYVKYLLVCSLNGIHDFVLKAEIKYFDTFNYHLFSRDLNRKITKYSSYGIDKIIILPNKQLCSPIPLPRFEYREKLKDIREGVTNSFKTINGSSVKMSYDWTVLIDAPDYDFQSIYIDSIPEIDLYQLGNSLMSLGLRDFIIGSPSVGHSMLFDDNHSHIVFDIGDSSTSVSVVRGGAIFYHSTINMGGKSITQELIGQSHSPQEALMLKKNSTYRELGSAVDPLTDMLKNEILKIQNDYESNYRDKIKDYAIIGGTAALEFEEKLYKATVGIDRVYPMFTAANDHLIPSETRNYFFSSFNAFKIYNSEVFKGKNSINLFSSKAGRYGLLVKDSLALFKKYNIYFYSALAAWLILSAGYVYNYKHSEEVTAQFQALVTQYKTKNTSLTKQEKDLTDQNKSLVDEAILRKGKNTGELLNKMGSHVSPDLSVRSVNLVGDGETTVIEVASNSQKSISSYIVLLTTDCFEKANVDKVVVDESQGETVYVSTIKAQGRKL